MSGKHGRISTTNGSYEFSFVDAYVRWCASLVPCLAWLTRAVPQDFSVLGRSVVIHSPNTTRCAMALYSCRHLSADLDKPRLRRRRLAHRRHGQRRRHADEPLLHLPDVRRGRVTTPL